MRTIYVDCNSTLQEKLVVPDLPRHYLDLDTVELLSVVHTDDASDHLGNNNHVTDVGLDGSRALTRNSLTLVLAKSLEECNLLALETTVGQAAARASGEEIHQLLVGQVKQLVQIHSAVRVLAEGSVLLQGLECKVPKINKDIPVSFQRLTHRRTLSQLTAAASSAIVDR